MPVSRGAIDLACSDACQPTCLRELGKVRIRKERGVAKQLVADIPGELNIETRSALHHLCEHEIVPC